MPGEKNKNLKQPDEMASKLLKLVRKMVKIIASEYVLGSKKESLKDLCALNPKWDYDKLLLKTGVKNRHVLGDNETPEKLSIAAGKNCINKIKNQDIDGIIYVSQSPSQPLPTRACYLQEKLKIKQNSFAFDINQGCSGFVYALSLGTSLISSKLAKRIMKFRLSGNEQNRYLVTNEVFKKMNKITKEKKNKTCYCQYF